MSLVATLVASPADPQVSAALIAAAAASLGSDNSRMLNPGIAADLLVPAGMDAATAAARLADVVAGRPVDVAVLPAEGRAKRLLIADMDSTMIGQECIDELADYAGVKAAVSEITERAMRGEISFEPALRERVALLKGLPVSVVDAVIADRIRLTPGGPELVRSMRAKGAYTALVSGGFTLFTGRVAAMIGFHEDRANTLITDGDRFAGTVAEPILGREAKLSSLKELAGAKGIQLAETLAVGDGANDLAMIRAAGLGVAYRAKPAVAAEAHARVDHADLTALLYFQGYMAADIFC